MLVTDNSIDFKNFYNLFSRTGAIFVWIVIERKITLVKIPLKDGEPFRSLAMSENERATLLRFRCRLGDFFPRIASSVSPVLSLYFVLTPPETCNIPILACFVCMYPGIVYRAAWASCACAFRVRTSCFVLRVSCNVLRATVLYSDWMIQIAPMVDQFYGISL